MCRKAILLAAIAACSCSAGPTGPKLYDYQAPAVNVHVRYLDWPTSDQNEVTLQWVHWTGTGDSLTSSWNGFAFAQLHANEAVFPLVAGGQRSSDDYSSLRFFSLFTSFSAPAGAPSGSTYWTKPGLFLVYAQSPTTWSPFALADQAVTFPQGYSWLRRTCGPLPGKGQLEVRSIDEVVEFQRVNWDDRANARSQLEALEQASLVACGITSPPTELGTRISFDRAQSLAWSPDNTSIYYLNRADPLDLTKSVVLRQIRLADSLQTEIALVAHGGGLQMTQTGTLFASDADHLLALVPTNPPSLVATTLSPGATVSPNGRWIAYWSAYVSATDRVPLHIWDIKAGADLTVLDGSFAGWSPDSLLAYWSRPSGATDGSQPSGLAVISLDDLGSGPKAYPVVQPLMSFPVWTSTGPLLARVPYDRQSENATCIACFGLSLLDATTGVERPILDASAGEIRVQPEPIRDFMFVWATNCLGLFNTVCSTSLIRVNLIDATVQTLAVTPTILAAAISFDGHRVALSEPGGIYVKDLP
jgi:hypothetical protein